MQQGQTGGGLQDEEGNSRHVPSSFASNLFVAKGIADSAQALIQMEGTEAWENGPGKTAS
jgi:hypothetical protein